MGNKLFGVNISGLVAKFIGPGVLNAILTKVIPGERDPDELTGGTNPTTQVHSCRGFIDSKRLRNIDDTLSQDGMEFIVLIGDTIAGGTVAPETGDLITIEGNTYRIERIGRDPAAAVYECACSGA